MHHKISMSCNMAQKKRRHTKRKGVSTKTIVAIVGTVMVGGAAIFFLTRKKKEQLPGDTSKPQLPASKPNSPVTPPVVPQIQRKPPVVITPVQQQTTAPKTTSFSGVI